MYEENVSRERMNIDEFLLSEESRRKSGFDVRTSKQSKNTVLSNTRITVASSILLPIKNSGEMERKGLTVLCKYSNVGDLRS
jgi:hypothetical protein